LGGEHDHRAVAPAGPGAAVRGVDERVCLELGEERDERSLVALGGDREDPFDCVGVLWVSERGVAVKGTDGGQPRVAGAGAASPFVFEIVKERAYQ
jgi:hypothetical protein